MPTIPNLVEFFHFFISNFAIPVVILFFHFLLYIPYSAPPDPLAGL